MFISVTRYVNLYPHVGLRGFKPGQRGDFQFDKILEVLYSISPSLLPV